MNIAKININDGICKVFFPPSVAAYYVYSWPVYVNVLYFECRNLFIFFSRVHRINNIFSHYGKEKTSSLSLSLPHLFFRASSL